MKRANIFIFAMLVGMVIFANSANAALRPTFFLDWATWKATDIVVVDEGDTIDGKLTVIKSLQGSLKKGDVIVAPKLKKFHDVSWRTTGHSLYQGIVETWDNPKAKPAIMTGRRMLIFLQSPSKYMSPYALNIETILRLKAVLNNYGYPPSGEVQRPPPFG